MNKTACVHSTSLDGLMSAAIVKHFNDEVDFFSYGYRELVPDLSKYEHVMMVDVCFAKEEMELIADKLIWIDHHINSIKEIQNIEGMQNNDYASCELMWKYYFSSHKLPEIVKMIGMYDTNRHKGTSEEKRIIEFQYGARVVIKTIDDAYIHLVRNIEDSYCYQIKEITHSGSHIYKYLCLEANKIFQSGTTIFLKEFAVDVSNQSMTTNRRFLAINYNHFNPSNFKIPYSKEYEGIFSYYRFNGKWNINLYSHTIDCSVIAKQYFGDGLRHTAGFTLTDKELLSLMK